MEDVMIRFDTISFLRKSSIEEGSSYHQTKFRSNVDSIPENTFFEFSKYKIFDILYRKLIGNI